MMHPMMMHTDVSASDTIQYTMDATMPTACSLSVTFHTLMQYQLAGDSTLQRVMQMKHWDITHSVLVLQNIMQIIPLKWLQFF